MRLFFDIIIIEKGTSIINIEKLGFGIGFEARTIFNLS